MCGRLRSGRGSGSLAAFQLLDESALRRDLAEIQAVPEALSDEAWDSVASRFTMGPYRKRGWPKPDIVTVCTSPSFIEERLAAKLVGALRLASNISPVSRNLSVCSHRK